MKKTGEFLRKAREDKGLSVHEIGLSLKINPKILKQIEEGDKGNLPAKTFLRGFVQSYALFLKIDPNEVLRIFSDEMGTTKPHQISLTSGPQIKGNSIEVEQPENKDDLGIKRNAGHSFNKEKFEFKNVGVGIVVFILLLSLIAVRKVVEKYQKEAEVDLAKTEENLKSANKLELPQPPTPVTPALSADSKLPANGQPVAAQTTVVSPTATNQPTAIPEVKAPPALPNAGTSPPVNANELPKPTNKIPPTTPNAVTTNPTNPAGPTTATPSQNPNLPSTTKPTTALPLGSPAPTTVVAPKPVAPAPPTQSSTTAANPNSTKPTTNATTSTTALTTATAVTPTVVTTPAITPPKEEPKKPKNIELVIEAFESVEIEMTQSSGKTEKIKMSPSQIQTFKTVSGVKLSISNGGAVNLSVNGKDLGVPGDLGKPKKVSF